MSKKILTISIAAYNMEQYLSQCLDSLLVPEIIDELEVFIVDDGSTDSTLEIAQSYAERYPNTFIPIHQKNRGYGATVNYSIEHATGNYFRCLDADDWFDQEGLKKLIYHLRRTQADVLVTNIYKGADGSSLESKKVYGLTESLIQIEDIKNTSLFGMWHLCFKTEILWLSQLKLPEHMLYTDQIYSTVPFTKVKTIEYLNAYVYCYRVGREGQSISIESRIKHTDDALNVCLNICSFYAAAKERQTLNDYILRRVMAYYINAIRSLCLGKPNHEALERLKNFDYRIKKIDREIYACDTGMHSKWELFVRSLHHTNYWTYWLLILFPDKVHNWA